MRRLPSGHRLPRYGLEMQPETDTIAGRRVSPAANAGSVTHAARPRGRSRPKLKLPPGRSGAPGRARPARAHTCSTSSTASAPRGRRASARPRWAAAPDPRPGPCQAPGRESGSWTSPASPPSAACSARPVGRPFDTDRACAEEHAEFREARAAGQTGREGVSLRLRFDHHKLQPVLGLL